MSSPINSLQSKLDQYQAAINKTQANRLQWSAAVKQLIFESLVKVRQMANLDWSVMKIEGINNLESVRLHLEPAPSGIVINTNKEQKHLMKVRGALIFSQAHNGDLIIMVESPHIEELTPKPEVIVLDTRDPEELDEDYILKQAEDFIHIITEWENNTEGKGPIGFKNGHHD